MLGPDAPVRPPPLLLALGGLAGEIAATQRSRSLPGRAFFLAFGRPVTMQRRCGVWNARIGTPFAPRVPVVHETEPQGRDVVAVDRGDPCFLELPQPWRERHPTGRRSTARTAGAGGVSADVGARFADDARASAGAGS